MPQLHKIWRRFRPLLAFVVILWVAHLLNILMAGALTRWFGLVPRSLSGLDGVIGMPFLHGSWEHLWANTMPLLLLGGLILTLAPELFFRATAITVVLGGLLAWLLARDNNHIGASGLIFGWFGFMVALALLERSPKAFLGAALAIALYGAPTLLGLAPNDDRVSWDGHLAGLAAGVVAAWVLRRRPRAASTARPPAQAVGANGRRA